MTTIAKDERESAHAFASTTHWRGAAVDFRLAAHTRSSCAQTTTIVNAATCSRVTRRPRSGEFTTAAQPRTTRLFEPTLGRTRTHENNLNASAISVRIVDDQCALQFTFSRAFCCVLHRPGSQVIHRTELCFHKFRTPSNARHHTNLGEQPVSASRPRGRTRRRAQFVRTHTNQPSRRRAPKVGHAATKLRAHTASHYRSGQAVYHPANASAGACATTVSFAPSSCSSPPANTHTLSSLVSSRALSLHSSGLARAAHLLPLAQGDREMALDSRT